MYCTPNMFTGSMVAKKTQVAEVYKWQLKSVTTTQNVSFGDRPVLNFHSNDMELVVPEPPPKPVGFNCFRSSSSALFGGPATSSTRGFGGAAGPSVFGRVVATADEPSKSNLAEKIQASAQLRLKHVDSTKFRLCGSYGFQSQLKFRLYMSYLVVNDAASRQQVLLRKDMQHDHDATTYVDYEFEESEFDFDDASANYAVYLLVEKRTEINCNVLDHLNKFDVGPHFGKLLRSKKFCDVKLVTRGGEEIPAHKAVLATRSEVFDAMLQANGSKDTIEVRDVDHAVMQRVLEFVYTGRMEGVEQFVCELLYVANKYKVADLKQMCEESISQNFPEDKAVKILVTADELRCDSLKRSVASFILKNGADIVDSAEFKELKLSRPHLLEFIIRSIFNKKNYAEV